MAMIPHTYVEDLLNPDVYDRIVAAACFEEPDRVPIWDYIDNWRVIEYFAPGEKDPLKAIVKTYHGLGIDLCRGFGACYTPQDEGRVLGAGPAQRKISGYTLWNNPPVKTVEQLAEYHVQPPSPEKVREYIERNKKLCQAFAPHTMWVPGCNVGFDIYYAVTDFKTYALAIHKAPHEIRRIAMERNQASLEYVKAAAKEKLSPLFFIGEDIAFKTRPMFSPQYLKKEFIPLLKNLTQPLKQAGIKVIFHSDGYLPDQLIDELIKAGVDGLNPIEPIAGMDIAHLKQKYYGKLILVGNLDCSQTLPLATPQQVARETIKLIKTASPGGGHFIGSSSEITPATPLQNILTFYRTIHRYGRYPLKHR